MQGDSDMEVVGRVHGVRYTSQCCCSCCIAYGCLLDLHQAAVSKVDACRAQAKEVALKVVLVGAEAQRGWHHHRMQGED